MKGLLDNLKNYPVLKHLVTWGEPLSEDLVALAKQLEVSTHTVEEIEVCSAPKSEVQHLYVAVVRMCECVCGCCRSPTQLRTHLYIF